MEGKVKIVVLDHAVGLDLPKYATQGSSGMDLIASTADEIILNPMDRCVVPTGICFSIPEGFEAQIRPRSGLSAKNGITVLNSPGTIDSDYRGEVKVILINHGDTPFSIKRGDRIAQIVFAKYERVNLEISENLENTERGEGGFGSTGK